MLEVCLGRRNFRCLHTDPPRLVHHPLLELRLPPRRETTPHPPALLALIPVVLTKSMVRCLVSIRINKKHTLYALAGVTLSNLIATSSTDTGDDGSQDCLAIANTLVQYEGAMFDVKTNSSTVKDLLSGLDSAMVLSYVRRILSNEQRHYSSSLN